MVGPAADPDDDAFLAELRKAMLDDEPLGPQRAEAPGPADGVDDDAGRGPPASDAAARRVRGRDVRLTANHVVTVVPCEVIVLVICALALVAAAAVLLVIGLAGGDVDDLYLSMVLCVASLVVVAVSARLSRSRPRRPPASPRPGGPHGGGRGGGRRRGLRRAAGRRRGRRPGGGARGSAGQATGPGGDTGRRRVDWAAGRTAPDPAPVVEDEGEGGPSRSPTTTTSTWPDPPPAAPAVRPSEVPAVAARERATKARPAVLDALAAVTGDPAMAFPDRRVREPRHRADHPAAEPAGRGRPGHRPGRRAVRPGPGRRPRRRGQPARRPEVGSTPGTGGRGRLRHLSLRSEGDSRWRRHAAPVPPRLRP